MQLSSCIQGAGIELQAWSTGNPQSDSSEHGDMTLPDVTSEDCNFDADSFRVVHCRVSGPPCVGTVYNIHAYICGLNEMVSANRETLGALGWQRKQIVFERYD